MKKLLHYIWHGDPTENPWDWFIKVLVPFYLGGALLGLLILSYFFPITA